jgi:hypothetical protein
MNKYFSQRDENDHGVMFRIKEERGGRFARVLAFISLAHLLLDVLCEHRQQRIAHGGAAFHRCSLVMDS